MKSQLKQTIGNLSWIISIEMSLPWQTNVDRNISKELLLEGSLIKSLEPVRKATYLLGILPEWCRYTSCRTTAKIANVLGTVFNLLVVGSLVSYKLYQLVISILESPSIHHSTPPIVWLLCFSSIFVIQIYFIYQRREMIVFFSAWHVTYQKLAPEENLIELGKVVRSRMLCLVTFTGVVLVLVAVLPFVSPQTSMINDKRALLISYPESEDIFTTAVLIILHAIGALVLNVMLSVSDMVPALTYHHAAVAIQALDDSLQTIVSIPSKITVPDYHVIEERLLRLWTYHKEVNKLIARTNELFGLPLITTHTMILLWLIIQSHIVLFNLNNLDWILVFIYSANNVLAAVRIIVCVFVINSLQKSAAKFKATLNEFLTQNWDVLTKREYQLTNIWMYGFEVADSLASPCNLYNINRSLLLNILEILITFIFILSSMK